jgi:hypothetical protein
VGDQEKHERAEKSTRTRRLSVWLAVTAGGAIVASAVAGLPQSGYTTLKDALFPTAQISVSVLEPSQTVRHSLQMQGGKLRLHLDPGPTYGNTLEPEYWVPRSVSSLPPAPSVDSNFWSSWVKRMGGAPTITTLLQFVVQGETKMEMLIDNVQARIVRRSPLVPGTVIGPDPGGCGGFGEEPVGFLVNLDADPPTVDFEDLVTGRKNYVYTLSPGQIRVFYVVASGSKATYDWHLTFRLTSEGKSQTVVVEDHGRPFHLVNSSGRGVEWIPVDHNLIGSAAAAHSPHSWQRPEC